jgi:hypothetical protein
LLDGQQIVLVLQKDLGLAGSPAHERLDVIAVDRGLAGLE